ncbi:GyrI-like domain-containing protein [Niveibacterium terrae]|uniref:GyrI-like domain-containing protein n=1 Tax=Niveibacterium terrae TaxID=3373598 RepID=UPI003A95C812
MEKIDLKKELKSLYLPSAKAVSEIEVPQMNYLMVDGEGDPNTTPAYAEAIEALFAVSYAVKFMVKKGETGIDYGVMPLEGLWWAEDPAAFMGSDKSGWQWTMMIAQPAFVPAELIARAIAEVRTKKNPPALSRLRLEPLEEGRCAQILHIGPFSEEGASVAKLHQYIADHGEMRGKHHEIYLSDIRKAAPEKWKTVIRQPMR